MSIFLVVAAAQNKVIGNKGTMPWHLPADLARFKQLTIGHPIIMGRKTFESIGRALPGRKNIVISRDKNFKAAGSEVVGSLDEAVKAAGDESDIFVIGGASIYEQALPLADKVYLTSVEAKPRGDTYFYFKQTDWKLNSNERHQADNDNQYSFNFQVWVKK